MSLDESRWDRFELRGRLGSGATGEVFRAFDPNLGREVALKIFSLQEATPRHQERFAREGAIVARLSHPGIVKVYSTGRVGGRPYVVYEEVQGCRTLGEVAEGLTLEQRVQYVIDAAEALGYAHQEGVVHRDVKLENLLLDGEARLRVADFGHASASDLERLTVTGALVGTPLTMSPEQLTGQRGVADPRSDVWSLGVVAYRLLGGCYPFEGAGLLELSARVSEGRYVPLRTLAPEVTSALEAVVARALQVRPQDRWSDGAALAEALAEALAGEPSGRPSSAPVWAVGVIVALLLALGAASLAAWSTLRVRPSVAHASASPAPTPSGSPTPTPAVSSPAPRPNRAALGRLMAQARYGEVESLLRGGRLSPRERFLRGLARMESGRLESGSRDLQVVARAEGGVGLAARAVRALAGTAGKAETQQRLVLARRAQAAAPEDLEVVFVLVRMATDAFKFREAERALAKIATLRSDHWREPYQRSKLCLLKGDPAGATAALEEARRRVASRTPLPIAVHLQAASIAAHRDQPKQVLRALDLGVGDHPRAVLVRALRAIVFSALGDPQAKAAEWAALKKIAPSFSTDDQFNASRDMIEFVARQKELNRARGVYRKQAARLGPMAEIRIRSFSGEPLEELLRDIDRLLARSSPAVRFRIRMWRIQILRSRGRFAEVVRRLRPEARGSGRAALEARYLLGVCSFRVDQGEQEGLNVLRTVAAEDPAGLFGLAAKAFLSLSNSNWERGVAEARQALALSPTFLEARLSLAYGLGGLKRFKESRAEFRRCALVAPDLPRLILLRGLTAQRAGAWEAAARNLIRWVRVVGGRAQAPRAALFQRAYCAARTHRFHIARLDFDELLRRRPSDPSVLIGRGLLHDLAEEPERGRADWRVAAQQPGFADALETFPPTVQKQVRVAIGSD